MRKTAENVNGAYTILRKMKIALRIMTKIENRKIKKGKYISRPAVHTLLLRRGRTASNMRSLREWMSTLCDTS